MITCNGAHQLIRLIMGQGVKCNCEANVLLCLNTTNTTVQSTCSGLLNILHTKKQKMTPFSKNRKMAQVAVLYLQSTGDLT